MENSGCDPNGDVDPKYYVAQMDLNNDIAENSYGLEITEDTLKGTSEGAKGDETNIFYGGGDDDHTTGRGLNALIKLNITGSDIIFLARECENWTTGFRRIGK